ncbi:MAG: hypothetical protein Q8R30_02165 [bacterium]|nr:hypothetical protein [bacterium]
MNLQKPPCPQCGSSISVIPIIYGAPTKELLEQMSRGQIELGGHIMVGNRQPPWTCTQCQILIDTGEAVPQS